MTKEILTRAVILELHDSMKHIEEVVSKSTDLKEVAQAYRDMADLCDKVNDQLEKLEEME